LAALSSAPFPFAALAPDWAALLPSEATVTNEGATRHAFGRKLRSFA
jgi:hypothetical protein